jgi:phosphohistidine phosphatase
MKNNVRKILLILRHAKSSWKEPDLQDFDRPLNKRGKSDAPKIGKLLKELDLVPDLIISSAAKRAKDTAKAVVKSTKYHGRMDLNPSLYGAADFDAYLRALRLVPDEYNKVLIIGHNPALEELVRVLTDRMEHLPTCALAEVDLKISSWSNLGKKIDGQLINIWRPRELEVG